MFDSKSTTFLKSVTRLGHSMFRCQITMHSHTEARDTHTPPPTTFWILTNSSHHFFSTLTCLFLFGVPSPASCPPPPSSHPIPPHPISDSIGDTRGIPDHKTPHSPIFMLTIFPRTNSHWLPLLAKPKFRHTNTGVSRWNLLVADNNRVPPSP